MGCNTPYWLRRLNTKLCEAGPVKRAYLSSDLIRVLYITGMRRTYTYNTRKRRLWASAITKNDSKCEWPIEMSYEHEWNPLNNNERAELSKYFHVPRSRINKLSYMERELLIQHIISIVLKMGYTRPYRSEADIDADLEGIDNTNDISSHGILNVMSASGLTHSCKHKPGRAIIEKYCDIDRMTRGRYKILDHAFHNKKVLYTALHCIIGKTQWDINITTIHSMLYRRQFGPRWYSPAVYKIIIGKLYNINQDTILVDSRPNIYEKAIASKFLGCIYATIDGSSPPKQMVDRIGIRVGKATKPYDLLIADNAFRRMDVDQIMEIVESSRNALVYVRANQAKDVLRHTKPFKAVKIKTSIDPTRAPDYLFQYRSAKI